MAMTWTGMALTSVLLSNIASMFIAFKLYRDWDFRVSSVRWLFLTFFIYLWLYTLGRAGGYLWVGILPNEEYIDGYNVIPYTGKQLDRLGIYATMHPKATLIPTTILCYCDVMHFAVSLWVFPLTHELSKIAAKSMDRGATKERAKIRMYAIVGHGLIGSFLIVVVLQSVLGCGYSDYAYRLALGINILQIIAIGYMGTVLFLPKCRGRDVETINIQFKTSPVYNRLKRIMIAYALLVFQHAATSLVTYIHTPRNVAILSLIGLSQVMYNASGLALALCTGCSQSCTLRFCGCCIPTEKLAQLVVESNADEIPYMYDRHVTVDPPLLNPIFVVTDIESSCALWGVEDGKVMQRASQVHDDTLRSLLATCRGYEITTAGDSFQLAFHTIREAVSYCLDVQVKLLAAPWPKELHSLILATKKRRAGHRVIFRGLRVRMGIHDAMGSDGYLHHSTHAVTGKRVYTGVSEVIASKVSDIAAGGQILITQRVADWLMTNKDALTMDYSVDYLCGYMVPQVNMPVAVYEVLPKQLAQRRNIFARDQNSRIPHVAIQSASASTLVESGPLT